MWVTGQSPSDLLKVHTSRKLESRAEPGLEPGMDSKHSKLCIHCCAKCIYSRQRDRASICWFTGTGRSPRPQTGACSIQVSCMGVRAQLLEPRLAARQSLSWQDTGARVCSQDSDAGSTGKKCGHRSWHLSFWVKHSLLEVKYIHKHSTGNERKW